MCNIWDTSCSRNRSQDGLQELLEVGNCWWEEMGLVLEEIRGIVLDMDSRVGEERRKGYFLSFYLKVLFFSTSFLYLDFSFLFALYRANLKYVLTSVSLFTWCKIL